MTFAQMAARSSSFLGLIGKTWAWVSAWGDAHGFSPRYLDDAGKVALVRDVQRTVGTEEDGILGPQTYAKMTGVTSVWPIPGTKGIDISVYQGHPDFKRVAAAGIEFVIHKVSEGNTLTDTVFERNIKAAADAGLACGIYHFDQPDLGAGDPEKEAARLVTTQRKFSPWLHLRPWQDLEKTNGLTPAQLSDWAMRFVKVVEDELGVAPTLYSGRDFLTHRLAALAGLEHCPLVIAQYPLVPKTMPEPPAPWTSVAAWQWTGHGRVDGVDGNVDLDVAPDGLEALHG